MKEKLLFSKTISIILTTSSVGMSLFDLVNSDIKFGKLYANPKVHKNGIPLRTILNVGNHPTANMAEIVEHELAENVRSLPSFIQDTTDFLNKLSTINRTKQKTITPPTAS
jgi:hypothetical protein